MLSGRFHEHRAGSALFLFLTLFCASGVFIVLMPDIGPLMPFDQQEPVGSTRGASVFNQQCPIPSHQ